MRRSALLCIISLASTQYCEQKISRTIKLSGAIILTEIEKKSYPARAFGAIVLGWYLHLAMINVCDNRKTSSYESISEIQNNKEWVF